MKTPRKSSSAEQAEIALEKEADGHSREIRAKIHAVFNELDIGDVWNVSVGQLVFWIKKTGPKSMILYSGRGTYLTLVSNRILFRLRNTRYKVTASHKMPKRR